MPKAQVVIGEGDRVRLDSAAFHRFLDRPAAVQARPRTTAIDAFAHVLRLLHAVGGSGLEIGELQLFPQPVEDVVDFELENEFEAAFSAARTAVAAAARGGGSQHVAGFRALALSHARLRIAVRETESIVLEKFYRHLDGAILGLGEYIRSRDQIGQGSFTDSRTFSL